MYRKLFIVILTITLFSFSSFSQRAYALNPKVKVLLSTGSYGIIGGALLGTATLAFGTSGRAPAQGASIGLWTGLLFGSYIILSHMIHLSTSDPQDLPYGGDTPYGDSGFFPGGGEVEVDGAGNPLENWNPYQDTEFFSRERDWTSHITPQAKPLLYLNVLQVSF
jgi:hypothetical protein